MIDQRAFMETLRSVQEVAKASQEPLSQEEIKSYFQDMELSSEQQQLIYDYLSMTKEQTENEQNKAKEQEQAKRKKTAGNKKKAQGEKTKQNYFQIYLKDISTIPELTSEQENILYQRLLKGEEAVIADISHHWLKRIVELAEHYTTAQIMLEDLVQEGNIGLLLGMRKILGNFPEDIHLDDAGGLQEEQKQQLEQRLEMSVKGQMEEYCRQQEGECNGTNTILAKVNLLHEAKKALAEENGTIPTLEELCDYTKISQEEIEGILALHSGASQE